jgi:hypothetical protein
MVITGGEKKEQNKLVVEVKGTQRKQNSIFIAAGRHTFRYVRKSSTMSGLLRRARDGGPSCVCVVSTKARKSA